MQHNSVECRVCKEKDVDIRTCVTCFYCFSSAHYTCKNISRKAKQKIEQNGYFCTPKCVDLYIRITAKHCMQSPDITLVRAEIKSTVSQFANEVKTVNEEVRSITTAIEKSQEYLSSKFDIIVAEINKLKSENISLKQDIEVLKKSENNLKLSIQKLEVAARKADHDSLSKHAMFFGLPSKPNEDVAALVHRTARTLGVSLKTHSIVSATRLASNKKCNALAPIKVIFNSNIEKESILAKKKEIGKVMSTSIDESLLLDGQPTYIVIRDELPHSTIELLRELRSIQRQYNIKYIWPGKGGIILMKLKENSKPQIIKTLDDFKRAMAIS